VNGARYDSPPRYNHKKPAQNAVAEAAVKNLLKQGLPSFEVSLKSTQMLKIFPRAMKNAGFSLHFTFCLFLFFFLFWVYIELFLLPIYLSVEYGRVL